MKNSRIKNGIMRIVQGIIIGAGAILPGISGGVLAVVFGIYRPAMELLTHPRRALQRYWRMLLAVGIVSAKYSSYSNTTVEGIGFAIPINDVVSLVKDIMTNGYVTNKAYMGITPQTMTAQMAQQYRYDVTEGVFVCSVDPDSAAAKAGLKLGDVITKMDDKDIASYEDLVAAKKSYSAGDTVTLTVYREGKTIEVELTFDAVPESAETNNSDQSTDNSYNGNGGYGNGGNGYYSNPWDFFNNFFGYNG